MKKYTILRIIIFLSTIAWAQSPKPVLHLPLNAASTGLLNLASVSGVGNGVATAASFTSAGFCSGSGSYNFDRANEGRVTVANNSLLGFNNQFTICAWVYTLNSTQEQEVFSKGDYNFGVNSSQIEVEIPAGTQRRFGSISSGLWTHIALVRNGANLNVYKNGLLVGTTTTGITTTNSGNLFIGNYNSLSYGIDGNIQDARVYDVELTSTQVYEVFNSFSINYMPISNVCGNANATLQVTTIHGSGHTFQWFQNGNPIIGETTSTLIIPNSATSTGVSYTIEGQSSCNSTFNGTNFTSLGMNTSVISLPTVLGMSGSASNVCPNLSNTITCSAVGTALNYQWAKNGIPINAGTDGGIYKNFNSETLSITGFPISFSGQNITFTSAVLNTCQTITSSGFVISVLGVPSITGISGSSVQCAGNATSLSGTVLNALQINWLRSGNFLNVSSDGGIYGNTFSTTGLNISALPSVVNTTILSYTLSVSGICGSFNSSVVAITVSGFPSILGINGSGSNVCPNTSSTITCSAVGAALNYQWAKNGIPINAGTDGGIYKNFNSETLSITGFPISFSGQNMTFTCEISNICQTITSTNFDITILGVSSIAGISNSFDACSGTSNTISGTVYNVNQISWLRDGNILNASSDGGIYGNTFSTTGLSIVALPSVTTTSILGYTLSVSGICGSTSLGINVTVNGITSISGLTHTSNYCLGNSRSIRFNTLSGANLSLVWGMYSSTALGGFSNLSNNSLASGVGTTNGVNTNGLTISGMLANIPNVFIATVSGICGAVQTSMAGFNYLLNTTATSPLDETICNNTTAIFNTTVSGTGPFSYQWYQDAFGVLNIQPGAISSVYSFTGNSGQNNNLYLVSVAGACNSFTTTSALLTVKNNTSIDVQPINTTICAGSMGSFNITATSVNPVYQWRKNGVDINLLTDGGIYGNSFTTSGLTISNVPISLSGVIFSCSILGECGAGVTSSNATLSVASLLGFSVQPPSSINTCVGLGTFIRATATGTGVNYQWQYLNSGVWTNVSAALGSFTGINSNQLNIFNFQTSTDGINFRVSLTGYCANAGASNVSTAQLNLGPEVNIFGFNSKYCENEDRDTIQAFTNLSMPLSTVAGVFASLSGSASIASLGFNTISIDPNTSSGNNILRIRYTSAPNLEGCRYVTTLTAPIYTVSGFGLDWISPDNNTNSFSSDDNTPTALTITVSSGIAGITNFIGTFSGMNQSGVVGNQFYPNIIDPKPTTFNSSFDYYLISHFTSSVTGCSDSISKRIQVFLPQNNFVFFPESKLVNKSSFCSTDDTLRQISYNGSDPAVLETSTYGISYCFRNFMISIPGEGGISFNTTIDGFPAPFGHSSRYDVNSFKLRPSQVRVGERDMYYYTDWSSGACPGVNRNVFQHIRSRQTITIFPKPALPTYISPSSGIINYCQANINPSAIVNVSGQNHRWFTTTSTGTEISSLAGLNSISLAQLGINTSSGVGTYKFFVRQYINGCPSDPLAITININQTPTPPIMLSSLPNTGACASAFSSFFNLSIVSTFAGALGQINSSEIGLTSISNMSVLNGFNYGFRFNFSSFAIRTVTGISKLGSCISSPSLFTLTVNSLPPAATILGANNRCMDYDGIFRASPTSLIVNSTIPLSFNGTYDLYNNNINTPLVFSITTFDGNNVITNVMSNLNKTTTGITKFSIRTINTLTGCQSIDIAEFEDNNSSYNIYSKPIAPSILTSDIFCNSSNYGAISVSGLNVKWYNLSVSGIQLGLGNVLNLNTCTSCIQINRFEKYSRIDTLYYATQTTNGCESTAVGVSFKMYEPFQTIPVYVSSPGSNFGIELTKSDQVCSNQDAGNLYIRNIQNPPSSFGTKRYNIFGPNINIFGGTAINFGTFSVPNSIQQFYVQEEYKTQTGKICQSSPTLTGFTIFVKPTPSAPFVKDTAFCNFGLVGNLRATSTVLGAKFPIYRWYDSNGLLIDQSNNNGSAISISGSTLTGNYIAHFATSISGAVYSNSGNTLFQEKFFVTQDIDNCESTLSSTKHSLIIYPKPETPSFEKSFISICSGSILPEFELNRLLSYDKADWYSSPNLNSLVGANLSSFTPLISNTFGWVNTITTSSLNTFYANKLENNITTTSLNFAGCRSDFGAVTLEIKANPPAPVVNPLVKYCLNDNISNVKNLTASGVGNNFYWYSKAGTLLNYFTELNIQNYISTSNQNAYLFTVKDEFNNCKSDFSVITVTVNKLPEITFSGLNFSYCENSPAITLTGFTNAAVLNSYYSIEANLSPFTVPSGMLITINGVNPKAIFLPVAKDIPNKQNYTIYYNVVDTNKCARSNSLSTSIYDKQIDVFGFNGDYSLDTDSVCSSEVINLENGNIPGSFSATRIGVLNNRFIAEDVLTNANAIDTVTIKYNYTDIFGCSNQTKKLIYVFPSPKAVFKLSSQCVGLNSILGLSTLLPKNGVSINQYFWSIDNQLDPTTSKDTTLFLTSGLHSFRYKVLESGIGCVDSIQVDSIIGDFPNAKFKIKNICFGDTTEFEDLSSIPIGGGSLDSLIWRIDNQTTIGFNTFGSKPKIFFTSPRSLNVTLEVRTQEKCISTSSGIFSILPTIQSYPYTQDFEISNGLWFTEGTNSSWAWGNSTLANGNIWATNLNGNHNKDERSYLNGPCFDLSNLGRPMISFDLNHNSERIDGMVLQFSTDGGSVWQQVEDFKTGINWYNSRNILNDPGEQNANLNQILNNTISSENVGFYSRQMGWNGNSFGWKTVRNTLDEAQSQSWQTNTNVRIRLAFASVGSNPQKGFAIDNFRIGSRSKSVLLENFVNATSSASNSALGSNLNSFILDNSDDLVGINYHTSFPATDLFNTLNPSDPATRVVYYGVENVPRSALDGQFLVGSSTSIGVNLIKDKTLITPKFEIRAGYSNNNNLFVVSAQFVATENININEVIAHLVILEKRIDQNASNLGQTYFNVMKKMLPSAAGTSFFGSWTQGQNRDLTLGWNYTTNDIFNKDSLGVAIFLQDRATKDVLQAAYFGPSQSQFVLPLQLRENNITNNEEIVVFPNPASQTIHVVYPSLLKNVDYTLSNIAGMIIYQGKITSTTTSIDIHDFVDGIYVLKIGNQVKKIIVAK